MLTPSTAAVKVRCPVDPRAKGMREAHRPRTQDVLESGRTPAARRRSASTHGPSRGDYLSGSPGDRAMDAPGVPGLRWNRGCRSDPDWIRRFRLGAGPGSSPAGSASQASLPVDLRRDRHRANLLWPRPGRGGPLGRPTPPATTTVFLLAPAVAGGVRGRRRPCRGHPEAGDDSRSGNRCQGVGGSQPGASERC